MLAVRINNKDYLDLPTGTTLSLTLHNPAFDTQGIARTYSYPIRIPLSDHNRKVLDHQHRLDSRSRKNELPQEISLSGLPFESGRVLIEEHTNSDSELVFQNEDLSSIDKLGKINIRDLLGTIDIPQTEVTKYILLGGPGPNFQITINDTLYTSGGLGVPRTTALLDLATAVNVDYPGVAEYNVSADEFRLITTEETFVVSYSAPDFTLISEQTLSDAREINLQAYITTAAGGAEPVAFPVVFAPDFYPRSFRYRFYLNHRIDGNYLTNGYGVEFGWATTYVPFVRLRHLLDLIATEIGINDIIFDIPTAEAADLDSLLIYNNRSLDNLRLENSVVFGEKEKNGFATTITLSDHVPDYTAAELLERITGYFNLNLRFERGNLYLRKNLQQTISPPKDWTSITNPSFQRTTNAGGGVVLQFEEDTDDAFSPMHDNYTVGDGSNNYILPARPLHDRIVSLFESNNERWKVAAITGQTGTSVPLDLETENQTLRLFFDRGQQNNEAGRSYWMGSTEATNYSGGSTGAISLDFASSTGIYPNYWQGWTQLLFSPTITRITALSVEQILALRRWVKTKVFIYHHEGSTTSVVERVQVKISSQGLGQAKVEYRKFEP
ncbi:MAG: hypothetical protein AAFO02_00615 [Bacteroidota bacterium]